jgi:transcriptional regulator with XRE-family HTH domain
MVRPPLSPAERARGERLGAILRQARGTRSMADVAAESGVPVETLRKIETGRIATPAFFTVVALAAALGVGLERVAAQCVGAEFVGAECRAADESPPRAASA